MKSKGKEKIIAIKQVKQHRKKKIKGIPKRHTNISFYIISNKENKNTVLSVKYKKIYTKQYTE